MWLEIGLCVFTVCLYVYYEITKQWDFFKKLGVPYCKPSFPFGSNAAWEIFLGKQPFPAGDVVAAQEIPNEKVIGYFLLGQPNFLVNDEDLAKQILIKDFEYFTDRRNIQSSDKYSNAFLTNLEGEQWKQIRSLMSGVFTSSKLKTMSHHFAKVGDNFEAYCAQVAKEGTEIDMKVVGSKMALDIIATSGFGIEENSFSEKESEFSKQANIMVGAPGYVSQFFMVRIIFIMVFPKLAQYLNINFLDNKASAFFVQIIRTAMKQRKETGMRRNDMIDLIMDELNKSETKEKEEFESEFEKDAAIKTTGKFNLKDSEYDEETLLISNTMLFFFVGFDTTSFGIAAACHKLAIHPEYQEKVFDEIQEVMGDDQEVTFEHISKMKYMDQFLMESLRFSQDAVPAHERKCTKDYRIPGTDIVIPKGKYVHVYNLNIVKSHIPDVDKFDPENYNPERKMNKFGTQIFGQGPRNCVGMRYALMVNKFFFTYLLRNHRVVRGPKTTDKLVLDIANPNVFKDGSFVKLEAR